jgi:hypothetical protein
MTAMERADESAERGAHKESAYVRSFNRFELKYVASVESARELADALRTHARPDPHSGERGYPVYSLYWDSPELEFFWEKLDGEKYRRKLRFRRYETGDQVYVEIKQRIDRTVQKRRTRIELARALELFGGGGSPDARDAADPVLSEALVLCRRHKLEPKVAVRYRRQAWFATFEPDLRVTFDTLLEHDAHELDLARPIDRGRAVLPPDRCVIEIKFNHRVPLWLIALIQRHGLEVVRFSKYCAAADLAFYEGRHGLGAACRPHRSSKWTN